MDLDKFKIEFLIETVQMKDISDEEYFSSEYKQYVSNSKLKLINPDEGGTPQKYKEGIKSSYNSSFEFGSSIHQLLLQKDNFVLSNYVGKPSAKLGLFVDKFIKHRQLGLPIYKSMLLASEEADYYKGKLTNKIIKTAIQKGLDYYIEVTQCDLLKDPKGREVIVLSRKVNESVEDCMKALKNNLKVRKSLSYQNFTDTIEYINEQALFIDIAVTLPEGDVIIIPFKLKLDSYSIDPEDKVVTLNDLKTTGKPVTFFMGNFVPRLDEKGNEIEQVWMNGSFQSYCYYRQIAIYMLILQVYLKSIGLEGYNFKSNMIVVESTPNYNADVFPVSNKYIQAGLREFKDLICRVAWHEKYGYDKEMNDYE